MLTTEPGDDVAPYHNRQIAVLPAQAWGPWLGGVEAATLLGSAAAGSLAVARVA